MTVAVDISCIVDIVTGAFEVTGVEGVTGVRGGIGVDTVKRNKIKAKYLLY